MAVLNAAIADSLGIQPDPQMRDRVVRYRDMVSSREWLETSGWGLVRWMGQVVDELPQSRIEWQSWLARTKPQHLRGLALARKREGLMPCGKKKKKRAGKKKKG